MEAPEQAPSQTAPSEMTEEQRRIVLDALEDKLLEATRYASGPKVSDEPGPQDTCCAAHLARYERDKEIQQALKARRKAVKATIALFNKSRG